MFLLYFFAMAHQQDSCKWNMNQISLIINQLNYLKQWKKLLPLLSIFPFTRCFFRVQKKIIPVLKIPCRVIRVAQNNILSYIFSVFVCKTDNNCGKNEENCKIVFLFNFFAYFCAQIPERNGRDVIWLYQIWSHTKTWYIQLRRLFPAMCILHGNCNVKLYYYN